MTPTNNRVFSAKPAIWSTKNFKSYLAITNKRIFDRATSARNSKIVHRLLCECNQRKYFSISINSYVRYLTIDQISLRKIAMQIQNINKSTKSITSCKLFCLLMLIIGRVAFICNTEKLFLRAKLESGASFSLFGWHLYTFHLIPLWFQCNKKNMNINNQVHINNGYLRPSRFLIRSQKLLGNAAICDSIRSCYSGYKEPNLTKYVVSV